MVILGLLLVLAAVGISLDVLGENTSAMDVGALGQTFSISPGWLFVGGVGVGVAGLIGVSLFLKGLGRARRRRLAVKESHGTAEDLAAERDRLATELDNERNARVEAERAEAERAEEVERVEAERVRAEEAAKAARQQVAKAEAVSAERSAADAAKADRAAASAQESAAAGRVEVERATAARIEAQRAQAGGATEADRGAGAHAEAAKADAGSDPMVDLTEPAAVQTKDAPAAEATASDGPRSFFGRNRAR